MTKTIEVLGVPWNGAAVSRFLGLRHVLNYWRLRVYIEDGLRVEYYTTRNGIVVTRIKNTQET